jgi:hypothetical protein
MPSDLLSIGHVYCEAWNTAYKGIVPDDFLWALTDNARARRFYERMGMTAVDSRRIAIGGRELEETGYIQTSI